LIIVFFVAYVGGLALSVGPNFLYAYGNGGYGKSVAPATLPLFAAVYFFQIPIVAIFVAITGALWLLNDLPPFLAIATRSTFAWAFDREFPEKFADVSERFHSPVWSIVLCCALAIPGVILTGIGPLFSLFFITIIDTFTYLFICIAALFFIKKFKSAYEKGAKLGGPATLYFFGIAGIIFWLFAIGFVFYVVFNQELVSMAGYLYNPFLEVALTLITFVVGAAIYLYYKSRNKKRGIDVSKIYGAIPPE
jgi:amino acid transporter